MTHASALHTIMLRWLAIGFALGAGLLAALQINAQAIAAHNSRAPVNYAADRIELQDRQNRVVLSGDVDVTQAGLRVRAPRMLVNYSDAGSLAIQRITATGGVRIARGNEAASGNVAIYDFNRRIITMAGNVRLRRGGDTLNGGRLVIDLDTGISSVDGNAASSSPIADEPSLPEADRSGGRVTGTFVVPQN